MGRTEFELPVRRSRGGSISPLTWLALLSCALVALLAYLAVRQRPDVRSPAGSVSALRVYCAAGVSEPIARALRNYEQVSRQRAVVAREDGSGRLFGQIAAERLTGAKGGADLFVSADASLLRDGQNQGMIDRCYVLAVEHPVIATWTGSDISPGTLRQMVEDQGQLRFGIASQNAAIGRTTRQIAERQGVLAELLNRRKLETENVMQLAQALMTKSIDVAILWDTTVKQINTQQGGLVLTIVAPANEPGPAPFVGQVAVGVVTGTPELESARRLAQYLSAPDGGLKQLAEAGFEIVSQPRNEPDNQP